MASTPLNFIFTSGVQVFTVDYANVATLVCVAASEDQAEWIGWSLSQAHSVQHHKGAGTLMATINFAPEAKPPANAS